MRRTLAIAVACLSIAGVAFGADTRKATNIPAQELETALQTLAKERELQIVFRSTLVKEMRTVGVSGELTSQEVLERLLAGTGLTFKYLDERTVTIGRERRAEGEPGGAGSAPNAGGSGGGVGEAGGPKEELAEVVVTAQKKTERLQDVPVPVAVINTEALTESNQVSLRDYYTQVPGLTVTPAGQSAQILSIRGLATGNAEPATVGVTVDDVPFGAPNILLVPDFDPGDLARIEVLRGPQGTLYGASTLGGLLKFVTAEPSFTGVSGRVEAVGSSVRNGAGSGYTFRGSVNVPLSDDFAIRASAFTRRDPGFIDNPIFGLSGLKLAHARGAHLAALWQPSDRLSLKLSAYYQDIVGEGGDFVNGLLGPKPLQQYTLPNSGTYDREAQAYSAILNYRIGGMTLTSLSGFNSNAYKDNNDFSSLALFLSPSWVPVGPYSGLTGVTSPEGGRTFSYTEELRLSGPIQPKLDGLLSVFYNHNSTPSFQDFFAVNGNTGAPVYQLSYIPYPATSEEYSVFGDLTYHATDRLDVQVGGREAFIHQTYQVSFFGLWAPIFAGGPLPITSLTPPPSIGPWEAASERAFTYLLTPEWKISPDLMAYARLASGYRVGGPNQAGAGVPLTFQPDKTKNYEIGVKGSALDHRLSFDASIYYIDWKDIQLALVNSLGVAYTGNASAAKSQGVELSVQATPAAGLKVAAWVTFSDAKLTEAFPSNIAGQYGVSGDRLPYNPRFSGHLAVDQEFPLASGVMGFVGAQASYLGDRSGDFSTTPQLGFPGYTRVDARVGLRYSSWTVSVYDNNLTDARAVLNRGLATPALGGAIFQIATPRTLGLSISKTF